MPHKRSRSTEESAQDAAPAAPPGGRLARGAALILFAVVALAPLPFGSADPAPSAFWCILLGVALVLAPVRGFRLGHWLLFGLAALVIAAYALVLHEQLAAHPWLSISTPHPIWARASAVLGVPLQPSVSIVRDEPWFALGPPLACMLTIMVSFLVCSDLSRARTLLRVVAWSGAAYAAYGILSHIFDPTHILWRDKQAYLSSVTGTFINRNTAAAYFGSTAVIWLIFLLEQMRRRWNLARDGWRALPQRLFTDTPRAMVIAFSLLFVCLFAMFMTTSRAGVVLSLAAMVGTFVVFFRRDLPGRSAVMAVLAGGVALGLVLLEVMGGGVNARFDTSGLGTEGRVETWLSTIRMIADRPWLGTGQGTFAWAFPPYRSGDLSMWGTWDRAHDTLLELAAEMGVPLAALVVFAWIVIFAVLIRSVRGRNVAVPLAALAVAAIGVLHSLVDFSLQITGYAVPALALVGAGLAQSLSNDRGPRAKAQGRESARESTAIAGPRGSPC